MAFALFLTARLLALVADQIALLVIPVAVYLLTEEIAWSGIALSVQWLPRIVLLPWLSGLVDRHPLRAQYAWIDLSRAALAVLVALTGSVPAMLAVAGLLSVLNGYAFVILEYTVASRFARADLPRHQSLLQTVENLSRVAGPAIGGLLLAAGSFGLALGLCAGLFALALCVTLAGFPEAERAGAPGGRAGAPSGVVPALALLWRVRPLRRLTGLTMGVNFLDGMLAALLPAIVITQLGRSEAMVGYLNAAGAGAVILAMLLLSRTADFARVERLGHAALAVSLGAVAVIALAPPVWLFVIVYLCYIVARSVFVLYLRSERVRHIPAENLGQVLGVLIAVILSTIPVSGLAVAALGARWPLAATLAAGIAATAAIFALAILGSRARAA